MGGLVSVLENIGPILCLAWPTSPLPLNPARKYKERSCSFEPHSLKFKVDKTIAYNLLTTSSLPLQC